MRLGLIGVGRIGARHAEVLRDLEAVDEVIVADVEPARAKEIGRTLGLTSVESANDLLAHHPDGVVIAAPTPAHGGLVRLAASSGVPVFCEKPLASDAQGTRELIDAVARAGVPLQMGFQRRFDPFFRTAKAKLASGKLGRLHSIVACTLDPAPPHPEYVPTSGGLFRDCSVHDIDAIRWVTGREIVEVCATGANRGEEFFARAGDVDTAHAILTLDDGTLATIFASRYNGGGYEGRLELHGSKATFGAGIEGIQDVHYGGFTDRFAEAYALEMQAFTELIGGKIENPCRGEDALQALLVADACELSRKERRTVRVEASGESGEGGQ